MDSGNHSVKKIPLARKNFIGTEKKEKGNFMTVKVFFYQITKILLANKVNVTWSENQEKVKFCHQYNCNLIQSLVHLLREIERSKALGVGEAKVETPMH